MAGDAKSFTSQLIALGCDTQHPAWPDAFARLVDEYVTTHDAKAKPLRVLSLFSGAGGLDIGFKDAGFQIAESVELEEKFCRTLEANSGEDGYFPGSKVNCIDIRDYDPASNDIDFIIGGPPCQTFSAAGRRANGVIGTTDARGVLFREYVRILDKVKPTGFLFENVYGIIGAQDGKPWKTIRESFEAIGYSLTYRILDAADYGAPQHRERLIIVGLRNGQYRFPRPLFGVDAIEQTPFYDAKTAIKDANCEGEDIPDHIDGRYGHLIDGIPPGLNYSYYTEKMGHPNPIFAWRSKFSDFMYKADPNRPVRTIKAQGGQYTGPYHWEGRHFSLPEYKRLQTFPDTYEVVGSRGTVIHQLGNSVPPQLARILALTIREQVFKRTTPVSFEYLDEDQQLSFRKEKSKLTKLYRAKAQESISKLKKSNATKLRTRSYSANLNDMFALKEQETGKGLYSVQVYTKGNEARFLLTENSCRKKNEYRYDVSIEPKREWRLPYKRISGEAVGGKRTVLTALWKTIESNIADAGGAADLVQLNGYYQYQPNLAIELKAHSDGVVDRALCATTMGLCTRRLLPEEELAALWEVSIDDVLCCAREMRSLGFEVRNNNTNPQIPIGVWLVPYEFPTLNPMSVQLRKRV